MTSRVCVICSGTPLTNEHVLPQWLAEPVGAKGTRVDHVYELPPEEGVPPRRWSSADGFEIKVKVVCKSCNEGWMSGLETAVKPVLSRLVEGRMSTLGAVRRAVLTRWLIKTIAMQQFAEPSGFRIVPDDLALIAYNNVEPPSRFQVWAAGNDHDAGVGLGVRGVGVKRGDAPAVSTWIHAMILRRLTLVTMDLGPSAALREPVIQGPLANALTRIWSVSGSAMVPPRVPLGRQQVPLVLHMLARSAT